MYKTSATLLLLILFLACSPRVDRPDGRLRVVVSILPQADFVRAVGGPRVEVTVMVGPGQSHETYEPTPRQVAELSSADVYFTAGIPLEAGLVRRLAASSPQLRVEDISRPVEKIPGQACHAEHPAGGHDHPAGNVHPGEQGHPVDTADFHTWMSPRNVKTMCRVIRDTLSTLDPGHRAEYEANCRRYEGQLDALDRRIAEIVAPVRGGVLFVYHPAFGYFCRDYGLRQEAVETEGKEPSSARLARLVDAAKAKGVRVIFVQPQFAARSAEALASAIGGAVVAIDPLPENYLREMETLARTIERYLAAGQRAL